jgi:hypothetical protein
MTHSFVLWRGGGSCLSTGTSSQQLWLYAAAQELSRRLTAAMKEAHGKSVAGELSGAADAGGGGVLRVQEGQATRWAHSKSVAEARLGGSCGLCGN